MPAAVVVAVVVVAAAVVALAVAAAGAVDAAVVVAVARELKNVSKFLLEHLFNGSNLTAIMKKK